MGLRFSGRSPDFCLLYGVPAIPARWRFHIFRSLYRKYWQFGFQTRLYDALCPQAYLDSLKQAAQAVPADSGMVLDLGCGSGLLLRYLEGDGVYLGTDRLLQGLQSASLKAGTISNPSRSNRFFLSDMTGDWPLRDESVDTVVAHFSIYTLSSAEARDRVYERIHRVLKPGGRAVIANPSSDYDARRIIAASLESLRGRVPALKFFLLEHIVYPLTYWFGLRYIQKQIRRKIWCGYDRDQLVREIEGSGLNVESIQEVYAGSGFLIRAVKPA